MKLGNLYYRTFPRLHQYLAHLELDRMRPYEGKAVLISKGMGKSKLILDWIANKFQTTPNILILCPKIALKTWPDEFALHAPQLKYTRILTNSSGEIGEWKGGILLLSYEMARRIGINFFRSRKWDVVVADESTKFKGSKNKITQIMVNAFTHVPYRIILTGRLFTNSKMDVFSQYRFLDDTVFGQSFNYFKFHYFFMGWNYLWLLSPTYKADFYRKIASRAILYTHKFMEQNEGRRFPRKITRSIKLEMNGIQRKYMAQLSNEFRLAEGGKTVYETNWRLAVDQKLRQVCAGFLYTQSGTIRFPHPKLAALREILEEVDKVVVFTTFKEEQNLLSAFIKLWFPKRLVSVIKAGMGIDKVSMVLTKHEGSRNGVLISNASVAKYSLSLSSTGFAVYHTRSFSFDTYDQSRGRITRLTSKMDDVYYYNLVYSNSIDSIIHDALRSNMSQAEYLNRVVEFLQK